jgi:large subunit ribosomal protein L4
VYDSTGRQTGEMALEAGIFGIEPNVAVMHQVVNARLAALRSGTSSTKTRGEVSGGGKKPWKQKGTGRARAGSTRSPLWRGGATIFGPQPRSYAYRLPKQARRAALCSALAQKARDGQVRVIDSVALPAPKTKELARMLATLGITGSVLIVLAGRDANVELSGRNLPNVLVLPVVGLNVEDVLRHETLLVQRDALSAIEARLAR